MEHDIITLIGVSAAVGTILQTIAGQGGQLLRLKRATAIEIRSIHCGAYLLNTISHTLWGVFGLGTANWVVFLPNVLGGLISAAIAMRILRIRRQGKAVAPSNIVVLDPTI